MEPSVMQLSIRRTLGDVPDDAANLIMAVRLSVVCTRHRVDPLKRLITRLGSVQRARRAMHIVQLIGAIWPDPFMLSPPCCRTLSFDEALLADLSDAVGSGDRSGFDGHASDLLHADARDQLWRELVSLSG